MYSKQKQNKSQELLNAVTWGNWSKAKNLAKNGFIDPNGIFYVIQKLQNAPLLSEQSEILRIIYKRGAGFFKDLIENAVYAIEYEAIENHDWDRLRSMIEDYPLEDYFITAFISIADNDRDNNDARQTIKRYDELYDLSSTNFQIPAFACMVKRLLEGE